MLQDDRIRLQHMLDSATEALSFAQGKARRDLEQDRMLVHSLVRCVEIIGEAASKVTEDTRGKYKQLPWSDIVGMRNRLVHVYFDIDLDVVWRTVMEDLPALVTQLRSVLSEDQG